MLPHTGLFLLGKVALQMRIRRRLKTGIGFQTAFFHGENTDGKFFVFRTESLNLFYTGEL